MRTLRARLLIVFLGVVVMGCPSDGGTTGGADGRSDGGEVGGADTVAAFCEFEGISKGVCAAGRRSSDGDCLAPEAYEEPDERTCDGFDNDCDGAVDESCDADGDGFCDAELEVATESAPDSCPNGGGDCWDERNSERAQKTFPGAAQFDSETECLEDVDDDEYGAREPTGPATVGAGTDACDDEPRAWSEESCSSCSDDDGDDYFAGCDTYLSRSEDCDDTRDDVYPGAPELCDGTDSDCDGRSDDSDEDASAWCRDSSQTGWAESSCVREGGSWCCTLRDGGTEC